VSPDDEPPGEGDETDRDSADETPSRAVEGDDEATPEPRSKAAADAMADAQADGIEARLAGTDGSLASPADGLQDPTEHVPEPEVPSIEPDTPEVASTEDVPEGLRAEFWELVFAANVALFGLALGAMLVGFDENVPLGVLSLFVGTLAAIFLAYRYRNRQHMP
jgi:hypothetical protein